MNVLSLFDGLSGCRIALDRIGITPNKYYASEIDKYAIQVAQANYPDTIQLGSVTDWRDWDIDWASIDLVTGGFPCQAWSVAGKQQGDKDERGMLFWTMLDIMKNVMAHNPNAYFLIENVKMKKDFEQYITHHTEQALGMVHKHLINSALVSAQNRNRYYWTNIAGITQPEDKGLVLRDVLEDTDTDREESYCIDAHYSKGASVEQYENKCRRQLVYSLADNPRVKGVTEDVRGFRPHKGDAAKSGISECGRILKPTACKTDTVISAHPPKVLCGAIRGRYIVDGVRQDHKQSTTGLTEQRLEVRQDGETNTLTTVQKDNVVVRQKSQTILSTIYKENAKSMVQRDKMGLVVGNETADSLTYRKLTPLECERLQTVPDNYTNHVSNTQRYKMIGNGWTVDVIAHILSFVR